jgi:hypothetical protein
MITREQIEKAKKEVIVEGDAHHEHDDCIRIAYEWLDAQKKTKNPRNVPNALKHLIERWAGRYVSQSDVEIAAHLHPKITGSYPNYNISSRLTEPSVDRLKNIAQAFTQGQRERHRVSDYSVKE